MLYAIYFFSILDTEQQVHQLRCNSSGNTDTSDELGNRQLVKIIRKYIWYHSSMFSISISEDIRKFRTFFENFQKLSDAAVLVSFPGTISEHIPKIPEDFLKISVVCIV